MGSHAAALFYLIDPALQSFSDSLDFLRGSLRIFIIHNPVSGTSDPASVRSTIESHCAAHGVEFEMYDTKPGDPIPDIVREATGRGFGRIAAAGGDGTISAAANGLLYSEVPLGILPLGSGNACARELGIPLNLEHALAVLTGSRTETVIDTLTAGGRHYLMNLSVGLSARTMAATDRNQKRWMGKAAYLLEGLSKLAGLHLQPFRVHIDDHLLRVRATEIVVANMGLVGFKNVRLSPNILPDDGLLNVCIIRAVTLGGFLKLLRGALREDPGRQPELKCLPVKREVRIEAGRAQDVQGDGEPLGKTPITVGIAPQSLRILIPDGPV
jgi:YegS/Rv2252/BmrU family lipid kinase